MRQEDRQSIHAREFRGYALDFAARLEAAHPHLLLKVFHASDLFRQTLFAASLEIDLDQPERFLARLAQYAPDILSQGAHLDPHAQIARALILLKPRRLIETLYGCCPDGLLGLFGRLGPTPLYSNDVYRLAFDLYSDPRHRRRASVLRQLVGQVRPEHILVASGLNDGLVHRASVERVHPREVEAVNAFSVLITDLCGATPETIRQSLDALPVAERGARITEWALGWIARQTQLSCEAPIPASDPDLKLRLGADLVSLGRRFRNCAGHRLGHTFFGQRLIYEWAHEGQPAVIELVRLSTGTQHYWLAESVLGPRNRRLKPAHAAAIQAKLDRFGILYEPMTPVSAGEQSLHNLIDHSTRPAWDDHFDNEGGEADAGAGAGDADHLLARFEQEAHAPEAA